MRLPNPYPAVRSKAFVAFALMCGAVCGGGCTTYDVERTLPNGERVSIRGTSWFEKRGIGKVDLPGFGTMEGYSADPQAESIKAASEGIAAGIVKGIGAAAGAKVLP